MILDTTAPAEELQDKLSALEQLLLAYGRVAIGFSGGVDSSFLAAVCARVMPTNTLLVHLTTPLIGTPEQASFERSVDGQANEDVYKRQIEAFGHARHQKALERVERSGGRPNQKVDEDSPATVLPGDAERCV